MIEVLKGLNRLKSRKIKMPVYTRPLLPRVSSLPKVVSLPNVSKSPEISKETMMYSLYGDCKHCEAMEKRRRAIDKWER